MCVCVQTGVRICCVKGVWCVGVQKRLCIYNIYVGEGGGRDRCVLGV